MLNIDTHAFIIYTGPTLVYTHPNKGRFTLGSKSKESWGIYLIETYFRTQYLFLKLGEAVSWVGIVEILRESDATLAPLQKISYIGPQL